MAAGGCTRSAGRSGAGRARKSRQTGRRCGHSCGKAAGRGRAEPRALPRLARAAREDAGRVARIAGDRNALTVVERDEVTLLKRRDASRTAVAARNAERQNLARQLTERRAALDAIDLDALEIRDE